MKATNLCDLVDFHALESTVFDLFFQNHLRVQCCQEHSIYTALKYKVYVEIQ